MGGKHSKHDHHNELHHATGHIHKGEIIPPTRTTEKVVTSTTTTTKAADPNLISSTIPAGTTTTTTIPGATMTSASEVIRTGQSNNFNLITSSTVNPREVIPGAVIQEIPSGTIIESTTTSINQPHMGQGHTYK